MMMMMMLTISGLMTNQPIKGLFASIWLVNVVVT